MGIGDLAIGRERETEGLEGLEALKVVDAFEGEFQCSERVGSWTLWS